VKIVRPRSDGGRLRYARPIFLEEAQMRVITVCLLAVLVAPPAFADEQASTDTHRGRLFWSGLALGVAGLTTSVIGATTARVESSSTGNAPPSAFQACVAQKSDPIYATNSCDSLKGKNRSLLWSGVAISAAGAALMIGSHTSADIAPGFFRLRHTIRF
jgi:hypothetical protein